MYTNSTGFFGAHQDHSHKVEDDQSVKYREGINSGLFLRRDGVKIKLQVLKWLDSNEACVMFSVEY